MSTPAELDNDVSSIYELIADVDTGVKKIQAAQLRQGSRLDQIERPTHRPRRQDRHTPAARA